MSKKTRLENFRVVVEPKVCFYTRQALLRDPEEYEKTLRRDCETIMEQIKRHVDDVHSVWVESDEVSHCEHCGYSWTEDNPHYNGGCCQADQGAEDARKAAQCADS